MFTDDPVLWRFIINGDIGGLRCGCVAPLLFASLVEEFIFYSDKEAALLTHCCDIPDLSVHQTVFVSVLPAQR